MKLPATAAWLSGAGLLLASLVITPAHGQTDPWVQQANAPVFPNSGASINSYQQLRTTDPSTVWAWGYNLGFHGAGTDILSLSTNGGQSWAQMEVASYTSAAGNSSAVGTYVTSMWMTDAQHAWMVISDYVTRVPTLQKTTTGLTGFRSVPAPAGASLVRFFSATTGVIFRAPANALPTWTVYRSTDGGDTWQTLPTALPYQANDAISSVELVGNSLWAVTQKGQLLRTADAGQTWVSNSLPLTANGPQVAFRDASNGLIIQAGQLLRTTDAGQSWQTVPSSGPRCNGGLAAMPGSAGTYVSFVGGACVPNCPLYGSTVTTDNGQTWQQLDNSILHNTIGVSADGSAWAGTIQPSALYRTANLVLGTRTARPQAAALAFPNPAAGQLNFAAKPYARTLTLLDATGHRRLSYPLPAQATSLDISACRPGLYVLQCLDGAQLYTQRLLVEAR